MTQEEMTQVIDTHLEAYRKKDLNRFMEYFHDEIEVYLNNQSDPWLKGKTTVQEYYQKLFDESPELSISIKQRMVTGEYIIDHEEIRGHRGSEYFKALRVYEMKNNKISKARYYI